MKGSDSNDHKMTGHCATQKIEGESTGIRQQGSSSYSQLLWHRLAANHVEMITDTQVRL